MLAVPRFVISTDLESSTSPLDKPSTPPNPKIEATNLHPPIRESVPEAPNRSVLPLSVKRVVIDPGHGGEDPGAISETGLSEKDVTLDIAIRLCRLMEQSPFTAILTRESDQTLSLESRVDFANSMKADLFVSIHINWVQPSSIRPVETYYVGPSEDPDVLKLATLENRVSNYSISEYRQLMDKMFLDSRRNESRLLAIEINSELYDGLKQINPKLENRGVKMAPFAVLLGTQMPAVLAEVSALSNQEEAQLLRDDKYKNMIAIALFNGINSYVNKLGTPSGRGI